MRKQYDIELGGSKMTTELAEHLMLNEMVGGAKLRPQKKTIEYNLGCYSSVVEDMRNFKDWCKKQGLKVVSKYRNRQIETENKEYIAMVIEYELANL